MGRKIEVLNQLFAKFVHIKRDSPRTRVERKRVIRAVFEDLTKVRMLPENAYRLAEPHVMAVVEYWKSQNIKQSTIINRVGVLRRVSELGQFQWKIPENSALGLQKPIKPNPTLPPLEKIMSTPFHLLVKLMVRLQITFGMTKVEVMRQIPRIVNGGVMVDRGAAEHHSVDRLIPILKVEQQQLFEVWLKATEMRSNLLGILPKADLGALYRADFKYHGLNPNLPLHHYYALQRYEELKQTKEDATAIDIVCKEMGFSARRLFLKILAAEKRRRS